VTARAIILRPSAKVNLLLRVGPRRPDGYHEVRTLLQSIAISDTLTITARRGPFVLATRTPGVPTDASNLVWKAAAALWRAAGRDGDPRDAHVKLDKQIPTAAGLGGGSADAAAALLGLNRLWDLRLSRRDVVALAARLGADVPFFLLGGTALGVGRGDEIYPVDDIERLGVVVIKPSFGVATAEAYGWFDADARRRGRTDPRGRPRVGHRPHRAGQRPPAGGGQAPPRHRRDHRGLRPGRGTGGRDDGERFGRFRAVSRSCGPARRAEAAAARLAGPADADADPSGGGASPGPVSLGRRPVCV
jgi:4-diphosphocytidyl-2-C-methyl-D-erythritol kinase